MPQGSENSYIGASSLAEQYAAVVNERMCFFTFNVAGKITDANDYFCKTCRYACEELVGMNLIKLRPEYAKGGWLESIDILFEGRRHWRGQVKAVNKDGSPFWLDLIVNKVTNDGVQSFIAFGITITELKDVEAANLEITKRLSQSEIRYKALIESHSDLIVILTPSGTRRYVNAAFAKFFGRNKRGFVGTSILTDKLDGLGNEYLDSFREISISLPTYTNLHATRNAAGALQWILWQVSAVFDQNHQLLEVISVGRNVTEMVVADLRKSQYLVALEKIAFKTSHSIRGPLTTMMGLVSLIDRQAITLDQLAFVANSFKPSLEKLDNAISDMSNFINENFTGMGNSDTLAT